MLACDQFLFLHLHKSGGTFVNELMRHCLTGVTQVGYHLPYAAAPDAVRHLSALGTVRNPLAYYVSWFAFQSGLRKRNALFTVCSEDGTLNFEDTISRLISLHERTDLVDRLASAFPDHYVHHGLNLTRADIWSILGSGLGFYSFLYTRLYTGAPDLTLLKQEALRPALADYLAARCPDRRDRWSDFLNRAPPMNISRHGHFADYYSPALKARVEQLDEGVFAAHDY